MGWVITSRSSLFQPHQPALTSKFDPVGNVLCAVVARVKRCREHIATRQWTLATLLEKHPVQHYLLSVIGCRSLVAFFSVVSLERQPFSGEDSSGQHGRRPQATANRHARASCSAQDGSEAKPTRRGHRSGPAGSFRKTGRRPADRVLDRGRDRARRRRRPDGQGYRRQNVDRKK